MWREVESDSNTAEAASAVDDFDQWAATADESDEAEWTVQHLPRARMTLEGVLGLLAAFFIGLPAPFAAGVAVGSMLPRRIRWLGIIAFFLTGYLSALVVRLAARAVEGDRESERVTGRLKLNARSINAALVPVDEEREPLFVPLAIAMAIRLPPWHGLIRPLVAVWWLSHFAAAAFLGHVVATIAARGLNNPGWMLSVPLTMLATFAFLFAGNLYLMLAVAACVKRPGVWLIVWRYRFFLDVVLAAFLLFAGR